MTLLNKLGVLAKGPSGETDPALARQEIKIERREREQSLDLRSARHILAKTGMNPAQQNRYLRRRLALPGNGGSGPEDEG